MFEVPVVLLIYNRQEVTRQVFSVIRQIQPKELFVIADGPKDEKDAIQCNKTRQIINEIDWKCNIHTHFAAENRGVARRPATGLNWVFDQVEKAIILEDDTLPDLSFFEFCSQLLHRYEHDESVLAISGTNLCGQLEIEASYGFSRFVLPPWGWASWRRAWQLYDFQMADWQILKSSFSPLLKNTFPFWEKFLDRYSQKLSSWDVQWNYTLWKEKSWVILPKQNLIQNLGYNESATFTKLSESFILDLPLETCCFPLIHPTQKMINLDAEIEPKVIQFLEEIMQFNRRLNSITS